MSISMLVLILVVMLIGAFPCFGADGGLRYSIMVSKFQNRSNWSGQWDLGDAWGAVLTDSLMQTGKFIVLGEKDMRQEAMDEQDLAASGRTAGGGRTVVTGQMTPAQLLIKGDITHFQDSTEGGGGGIGIGGFRIGAGGSNSEINAVLYVVDSSTGQVLASKKCYGKVSETGLSVGLTRGGFSGDIGGFKKTNAGKAVELAVDEAVAFMVTKVPEIPWTGEIVMVKGDKVYINRGTREGVSVGHTFQVGKVEVLRDPKTGEVLDQTIEKSGTIEVVSVKEKISICKLTQGSGITKGMAVMTAE
jgi:curli biogenesis system outer membrane secretion channel CsgG